MANFLIVVDPDHERRTRFTRVVQPKIAPIDGLVIASRDTADLTALWAILPDAPFSLSADADGVAIVWGEAITAPSGRRQDAAQLQQLWQSTGTPPPAYDGFYAAIAYHREMGLCAMGDLLGLFPVYYFSDGDVLLVASSPELMQYHPSFRKKMSTAGVIGLLLTNGLVGGQSLWQDVYRLSAGQALIWRSGRRPVEVEQYSVPFSTEYIDLPYSGAVDLLDDALRSAMDRHAPANGRYSLFLSGGLDSRTLAGYLGDGGNEVIAMTTGLPTDIEVRCAGRVAHVLGFEHRQVDVGPEQYPTCADNAVKWEHLAGGFSMISGWGALRELRSLAPKVVTGYLGDAIIGGSHIDWGYLPSQRRMSFEEFFQKVNQWGIQPQQLKDLSADVGFRDQVDDIVANIRSAYEACGQFGFQHVWCFDLRHRQRFHVGHLAWQTSFGAWPVMPFVDRQVLKVVAGLPTAAVAERRAQNTLVSERFPLLARLPLDRSSYDDTPLRPRLRRQLIRPVKTKFAALSERARRLVGASVERRSIYRFMDFNWAGWRMVRQYAEPYRARLHDLFLRDELARVLPSPDIDVHPEEILSGSAGLKNLLGLMLLDAN